MLSTLRGFGSGRSVSRGEVFIPSPGAKKNGPRVDMTRGPCSWLRTGSLKRLLLGAQDRILGGLGDAELQDLLLGDGNGLPLLFAELHHHLPARTLDETELADAA